MHHLRAVSRGKMRQIEGPDGRAVEAALYGCLVARAPHDKGGKTYMTLDISACAGDTDTLHRVDKFVERHASPAFSPLTEGQLIVKVPPGARLENADGGPMARCDVLTNAAVDVIVGPGAFGEFGYCWLLRRLKPHRLRPRD